MVSFESEKYAVYRALGAALESQPQSSLYLKSMLIKVVRLGTDNENWPHKKVDILCGLRGAAEEGRCTNAAANVVLGMVKSSYSYEMTFLGMLRRG